MTDLLLTGGAAYDGTGAPPVPADIAITGDAITAVGPGQGGPAGRTLDVTGLAVAPGFIDIHTHSDFSLLLNRPMRSSIAQGVTTEVVGNCGISVGLLQDAPMFAMEKRWAERGGGKIDWSRLAGYLRRVEDGGLACNVATLAGHGTIRKAVMDFENRPPTDDELRRMQQILSDALDDGAVGLSTGLEYLPGGYARVDEQAALARLVGEAGGFYATHLRNEGDTLIESVEEALAVAERAGVPLQLSHHKAEKKKNWGKPRVTLPMMLAARARGLDVLTDQYPYTAFMTGLSVILLPAWANDGTPADTVARLRDPAARARILTEMEKEDWDWDTIQVGVARNRRETQGLTLAELGLRESKPPAEAALDLMIDEEGWVSAVHFAMSEEDVQMVLRDPHTMIGSDGVANDPHSLLAEDKTHPRTYGTFPRVLARYVRDYEVISLAEAVRRMTTLPAQRLKLTDRGRLAVGMKADLTVFDPALIRDQATFDDPHRYPTGIRHVLVNGRLAIENGTQTDALSGRVLRR
ncbi:MAG: D-aminoacylase [Armatimonadetes bacterium]|nr:D-aminoacylase [Armatimonadota bacterium]